MRQLAVCLFLLGLCSPLAADLADLPDRASTDRSEYRHLVLDNGLRVVLLSDPDLNKSSAAIAVGGGSYNDPEERPGLAHFLEHMLFLGTEKYPDEAEYGNYLRSNGGYSNAFTSGDHTNYHFEINHQAYEGALDRFSQFFIAPLFTAEFTEREMNAVDSEFEKNLQNDGWRQQQMFRSLVRQDHPENHFGIGNMDTLSGLERQEFLDFYDRFYSANLMALAMTSSAGLDQMEAWARQYFSAIQNRQRPPVDYDADLIDPGAPMVAFVEPVQDRRTLQLVFPTRGTRAAYRSKAAELIGFMLGYEGAGSLLSHLKNAGLATALGAGPHEATKDYTLFYIDISLTPKGLEQWQQVMMATFAFLDLLRGSEYPQYLFQERATKARLDELYTDKGEGAPRALRLASAALHYPLQDAQRVRYLWVKSDPELYFEIIQALRPDNMIATLEAKGLRTDQVGTAFNIHYRLQPLGKELLEALSAPQALAGLSLPEANSFIPSAAALMPARPMLLIDEPGISLFYAQDTEFERPRLSYEMRFRQPQSMGALRATVLRDFYAEVVNEAINEQAYTATTAGLSIALAAEAKGLKLTLSGYDQSADKLLAYVLAQMRKPQLDEQRFAALKERKVRGLENAVFADAWRQAMEIDRKLIYENYFTPAERLSAAREVTLDDVRRFARDYFRASNLEMVAYGNLDQDRAVAAARRVQSTLKLKPVAGNKVYQTRLLELGAGGPVTATDQLRVNNSAYRQLFDLGEATPEVRAAAEVLQNFFAQPYYAEMRTRQQLGYIVGGFVTETEGRVQARFVIQSADYPADELKRRSEAFLATLPELFDALPDEQFEAIRAGVRAELLKRDKSIAERAGRYFDRAFEHDRDWGLTTDTVAALDRLTRDELRAMLASIAEQQQARSFSVLSFAQQHAEAGSAAQASFADLGEWKRKQKYH